jgi:hypothetical protein
MPEYGNQYVPLLYSSIGIKADRTSNNAGSETSPSPSEPETEIDREPWANRSSNGMTETHFAGRVPSQQLSSTADINERIWYQQNNQLANQYLRPEATPRTHSGRRHRHRHSVERGT